MSLREAADYVASRGRYGDTEIMHVNPIEIEMLERAGVPLTVNPETGKKEAFLPLILGGLGSLAGAGALGPGLALASAPLMGAVGSGLGSFIETGDLGAGIMSGITGYGLGSLASAGAGALGIGADAAKEGAKQAAIAGASNPTTIGAATPGFNPSSGLADTAANAASSGGSSGMLGGVGNFIKDNPAMAVGGAAAALPLLMGGPGDPEGMEDAPWNYQNLQFNRQNISGNASPTGQENMHFTQGSFSPVSGFAQGGLVDTPTGEKAQAEQVMMEALKAIRGEHPNPRMAIERFLAIFGPDAFEAMMAREKGSEVDGAGDGMSDSIPASINGQEPAALSDGEYVVPADVVSDLGNGSTDAGVRQLDEMSRRARMARGGSANQPPPVNPNEVMPG